MDRNKVLIGLGLAKRKANPLGVDGFAEGGVVGQSAHDVYNSMVQEKFPPRISPIGSKESVSLSLPPDELAETPLWGNESKYTLQAYDDPEVQAHERIHIGQTRLDNPPTLGDVYKAIGVHSHDRFDPQKIQGYDDPGDKRVTYNYEEPAYQFAPKYFPAETIFSNSGDRDDARATLQRYGNYVNLLKANRAGDRGIASIEVSVPQALEKDYLKKVPPPVPKPKLPPGLK